MIRIDAMWLAAQPVDMRAAADRLHARVAQVLGGAQAHPGYPQPARTDDGPEFTDRFTSKKREPSKK